MLGLSVVCPLRYGEEPVQLPRFSSEDELIKVRGGEDPGEARFEGAKKASNEWIVYIDGDAKYPPEYLDKIRSVIRSNPDLSAFRTKRDGGLWYLLNIEAAMVLKKDFLFERLLEYEEKLLIDDFGYKFHDLPEIRGIQYQHGFTRGERKVAGILVTGLIGAGSHLIMKKYI